VIVFISLTLSSVNFMSDDIIYITGSQIRAARALLRWSAEDLAAHSRIGVATIRRAEVQDGAVSMTRANVAAIQQAFEIAGVQFIPENGGGPGVRLRYPTNRADSADSPLIVRPTEDDQ
jgi:ribosome-binding protein aMBF1 (putative translation factor)